MYNNESSTCYVINGITDVESSLIMDDSACVRLLAETISLKRSNAQMRKCIWQKLSIRNNATVPLLCSGGRNSIRYVSQEWHIENAFIWFSTWTGKFFEQILFKRVNALHRIQYGRLMEFQPQFIPRQRQNIRIDFNNRLLFISAQCGLISFFNKSHTPVGTLLLWSFQLIVSFVNSVSISTQTNFIISFLGMCLVLFCSFCVLTTAPQSFSMYAFGFFMNCVNLFAWLVKQYLQLISAVADCSAQSEFIYSTHAGVFIVH